MAGIIGGQPKAGHWGEDGRLYTLRMCPMAWPFRRRVLLHKIIPAKKVNWSVRHLVTKTLVMYKVGEARVTVLRGFQSGEGVGIY